jgi:poly-gamma-glutamate capsule biosynthesis protein CapA/YwtB (metallophosphatase superfamily)
MKGISQKSQRTVRVRCMVITVIASAFLSAEAYEPSATMLFLGDIMLGRGVAGAHADGRWQGTLQSLSPVAQAADLALANLESPLDCMGTAATGNRVLIAPPESADALTSAGLDILSIANNHAQDAGKDGVLGTRNILAAQGESVLESESILLQNVRGISLAFLAADFIDDNSPGKIIALADQVRRLRKAGRIVVVSLHWGMEYQSGSDDLQRSIARQLADAGANILWGHHPHAVQETDWRNDTLVLYSLGNAVFDQIFPASARRGEAVWVEVDRSGVRFWASMQFNIDVLHGRTGSWEPATFRFSFPPDSIRL